MSKSVAESCGVEPLGEIVAYGMVAGPDNPSLNLQPANATRKALSKTDLSIADVTLFELNEAFAAVGIASARELGISLDVVNVNGGAIALGLHELRRRGGGIGAAALCGGGGQGDAIVVRSL
jgi:acetyl-CoA C-acetyltransferase